MVPGYGTRAALGSLRAQQASASGGQLTASAGAAPSASENDASMRPIAALRSNLRADVTIILTWMIGDVSRRMVRPPFMYTRHVPRRLAFLDSQLALVTVCFYEKMLLHSGAMKSSFFPGSPQESVRKNDISLGSWHGRLFWLVTI